MTISLSKMPYLLVIWSLAVHVQSIAQIPPGYYDDAEGLYGDELRQTLHQIIGGHSVVESSELWLLFESTDMKPDGSVWDMYSDVPDGTAAYVYEFVTNQCGNYAQEGDCFNREHSFPQSWYGSAPPMATDLFHIYPTDGFVNGIRGNFPFGQVGNANYLTTNGSKRGNCNWPGCSGVVFEPIDEYKGDFARSYFYMLTRYYPQIEDWESDMLLGDDFSDWAREMLMEWAEEDPVSQKEVDRNNAVYIIQGNRNPFIDRPEFAANVWDETVGEEELFSESTWNMWYSNDNIWFDSTTENIQSLDIYDSMGRLIKSEGNPVDQVYVNDLIPGVYIARAQNQSANVVLKFIKTK